MVRLSYSDEQRVWCDAIGVTIGSRFRRDIKVERGLDVCPPVWNGCPPVRTVVNASLDCGHGFDSCASVFSVAARARGRRNVAA